MVGAYMTDPLWISEYTVYLEQNFCVGHNDHHCIQMVRGPMLLIPDLTSQFSGPDAFPAHARHGHGAVLLPSGHLQHLLPCLWWHQAPHVNKVRQLFILKEINLYVLI